MHDTDSFIDHEHYVILATNSDIKEHTDKIGKW